ncbi:MAG: ABC transporter substrate-binding protein [Deltaproteobacteria bacterium]|nr:ABC transporter substrate-binding protein [Deltaproteobacteria bacterium]
MKRSLKTVLLICVAALLAYWVYSRSGSPEPSTVSEQLSLAWSQAPRTLDPRYAIDADSQYLENLLHCSLIDFDEAGNVVPDLASSWTWSEDNTSLTVFLKPDIRFSDGNYVTAEDVTALYEFLISKDHKTPSPRAGAFSGLQSITHKQQSVTFHLKKPDASFLSNLSVGILPKQYNKEKVVTSEDQVHGCGPYQLSSSDFSLIQLDANPWYRSGELPQIPRLNIRIVRDETTRLAKLRNGEVDLSQNNISRDKIAAVEEHYPELRIMRRSGLKTTYLAFNMNNQHLKNPAVRKAISLAINRNKIIHYILRDMAIPATTLLPPDHFYYNRQLEPPEYDPTRAEALLEEAGFHKEADGMRFNLSYKTSNDETRVSIARAIASDLSSIGIRTHVQPLEWGRFKEDVDGGKAEMWSLIWTGFKDPDIYRYVFASESFPPHGGNRGRYSSERLDKVLMTARVTTDPDQRKALYDQAQLLIAEAVPYAFLFHEENYVIMKKNIGGFKIYADGRFASLIKTYRQPAILPH